MIRRFFAAPMLLALGVCAYLTGAPPVSAQSAGPALTTDQQAGRGWFVQHCSYCHLPSSDNNKSTEPGKTTGPLLNGLFTGAKPRPEAVVRGFILKGMPKMPGFQYSLDAKQLDEIVAYLKTL